MNDVIHLQTCTSTMDEARQRARDGAPDGTVVIADTMTGGRGQGGNSWHAPEGGFYASIILRDIADPRLLTLALGNAVADILEVAGADPMVKWVNDVMAEDRKVAGILVEAESTGSDIDFVVAGIGINVNGTTEGWPDGLDAAAITLEQIIGCDTCIPDEQDYFIDVLRAAVGKVRGGDPADILATFRRRDWLKGRTVTVDGVTGIASGIDDTGRLLVGDTAVENGPVHVD